MLVSADPSDPTTATLSTWRWAGSEWRRALPALDSRLGAKGVTSNPTEADGYTPSGTYAIQYAFGQYPSIGGTLPYRQTNSADHWVDDPQSALYNTWQTGDAAGRWSSAEDLAEYELAVVFDFNQHPVVPNANSAIFLHAGPSGDLGRLRHRRFVRAIGGDRALARPDRAADHHHRHRLPLAG